MPVYVLGCVCVCVFVDDCVLAHIYLRMIIYLVYMRISVYAEGRIVCACVGESESEKETCHPRRDFQRTIMVILVAI